MTCPSCGAIAPAGARFCPTCGHGLSARSDERRVVTVLFADLVGFTGALRDAGPRARSRTWSTTASSASSADMVAFGGQVDKILGDAILALFGAPIAHEDDAERAVRAALRMQQSIAQHVSGIANGIEMRSRGQHGRGARRSAACRGRLHRDGRRREHGEPAADGGPAGAGAGRSRHPRRHSSGRAVRPPRSRAGEGPRGAGRGLDRPRADRSRPATVLGA